MLVGEIIKYYREKLNLTQAEAVEGICTISFLSKVENGKIKYTGEILNLISERLGIDLNNELKSISQIDKLLNDWHKSLIKCDKHQIEILKTKLEQIPFIQRSQHKIHYELLRARYFFYHQKFNQLIEIIQSIENQFTELSIYEKNFLLHLEGMYYLYQILDQDNELAIVTLKKINTKVYKNVEFYYHLALAYHYNNNKLLAYLYANKALEFFKGTSCYIPAIDAETLILLQYGKELEYDFKELKEQYKKLIGACEELEAKNNKAILLNNLGLEYFKRKEFFLAAKYFEESLNLTDNHSFEYLSRLYNYVESCIEDSVISKNKILNMIRNGNLLARRFNSQLYILLFNLLKSKIEKDFKSYYRYLKKVVTFTLTINHPHYVQQYGNKLYKYYIETTQFQKATNLLKAMNLN